MDALHYKVIDKKKKIIELTFRGESLKFGLKVKRSFTVLVELIRRYPEFMNIHELDGTLNDPNRALSSLRREDGYDHFLIEESREKQVTFVKLNAIKPFETVNKDTEIIKLWPLDNRGNLSPALQKKIFQEFSERCNITGIGLKENTKFGPVVFMKNAMSLAFDHRKPLSKGGTNQEHNFQLLSKIANDEKNKICNSCSDPQCDTCALAHPERVSVIFPTGQNISNLSRNREMD
ncbi:MAG: hypothetical protein OXC03_01180 [Flavobacteriaceae bacterium]|nr:hypothetical protein [Flavobacteriaceae bacterium]